MCMRRKTGIARVDGFEGFVIGADEVGWGAMAGPLVVCAVAAPAHWDDPQVTDSKALTARRRKQIVEKYREDYTFLLALVELSSQEIDSLTPAKARKRAFKDAVLKVLERVPEASPSLVVLDGNLEIDLAIDPKYVLSVPKADLKVPAVGLASIFAKVYRDQVMAQMSNLYKGYGFEKHVGYVTKAHKEALERLGPCPIHRRSYAPVARMVKKETEEDSLSFLDDFYEYPV